MGVNWSDIVALALLIVLLLIFLCRSKYNSRGFDRNGIHQNGTRYDNFGYDSYGYDRNGFDYQGYDRSGYDSEGYCREGYNREGKNRKGQYNRIFDANYERDGFYSVRQYPLSVTKHARQRIIERVSIRNLHDVDKLAQEAYCYGKSKRQVKRSSAALIEEIENRYDNGNVLIYRGYIYIFSKENTLITVYKNDRISL